MQGRSDAGGRGTRRPSGTAPPRSPRTRAAPRATRAPGSRRRRHTPLSPGTALARPIASTPLRARFTSTCWTCTRSARAGGRSSWSCVTTLVPARRLVGNQSTHPDDHFFQVQGGALGLRPLNRDRTRPTTSAAALVSRIIRSMDATLPRTGRRTSSPLGPAPTRDGQIKAIVTLRSLRNSRDGVPD